MFVPSCFLAPIPSLLTPVARQRPAAAAAFDVPRRGRDLSSLHYQPHSASMMYASAPVFRTRRLVSIARKTGPCLRASPRSSFRGIPTFTLKVQHVPDLSTVCDALAVLQTNAKAISDKTAQTLDTVKPELTTENQNGADTIHAIAASVQHNARVGTRFGQDAKTVAKDAIKVGKVDLELAGHIEDARLQAGGALSYTAQPYSNGGEGRVASRHIEYTGSKNAFHADATCSVVTMENRSVVLSLPEMNPLTSTRWWSVPSRRAVTKT